MNYQDIERKAERVIEHQRLKNEFVGFVARRLIETLANEPYSFPVRTLDVLELDAELDSPRLGDPALLAGGQGGASGFAVRLSLPHSVVMLKWRLEIGQDGVAASNNWDGELIRTVLSLEKQDGFVRRLAARTAEDFGRILDSMGSGATPRDSSQHAAALVELTA